MKELKLGVFEINEIDNIMIIGDIHGDYQVFVHCLVDICNVCYISEIKNGIEILKWNTNNTSIIIFCGDIIHRQRYINNVLDDECSDILLLKTIMRLQEESKNNGGQVIIITGNHEIMNILNPDDNRYTSPFNIDKNRKYFTNNYFINKFIHHSYAWIKINNILISHGGLCSDYLDYLTNTKLKGDDIIEYINNKYKHFFTDFVKKNKLNDKKINKLEDYNLFIKDHESYSTQANIFWCRQWGFDNVDCNLLSEKLQKVNCSKMIMAHCPQFLNPTKPQMISFKCQNQDDTFKIACVDLGMSRSFDNNDALNFYRYLQYNFNRKMSVLKLLHGPNNTLYFNNQSILTHKLSCIQYLLIKYGLTRDDWKKYNKTSNWLGFDLIEEIIHNPDFKTDCIEDINNIELTKVNIINCLLYPIICEKNKHLPSIINFISLSSDT